MALNIWRDYFLVDLTVPLIGASLKLIERNRNGELVDLQLVSNVLRCLGNTYHAYCMSW